MWGWGWDGWGGELSKYFKMSIMFFGGHCLLIIRLDWGKFFPNIWKWLTHTITSKKVTYFNASLKLWISEVLYFLRQRH